MVNLTADTGWHQDDSPAMAVQAQSVDPVAEAKYRILLNSIRSPVLALTEDMVILYCNQAYADFVGRSIEELEGWNLIELFPSFAKQKSYAAYLRALATGETQEAEGQLGSSYLLARVYRTPWGILSIGEDITERKRAEAALQMSEARYRAIVEDQTELICRFLPDGTLTFVNGAYCRYFNSSYDELVGHNFLPAILDEDQVIVQQAIASLSRENPVVTVEHRVVAPTGELRWQQWTDRAIFDEQGRIRDYQAVGRDISQRKRIEAVEHEQRQLAEALRDTAAALTSTLNFDEVLERILASAERVVPHGAATIMMIDEAGYARIERFIGYAGRGLPHDIRAMQIQVADLPGLQYMVRTGQPLAIPDTQTDPRWVELPGGARIASYAGAPIHLKGHVAGFVNLESDQANFFTQAHAERLQAFADQAGIAIENARLYEEIQHYAADLEARVAARTAELEEINAELEGFAYSVAHDLRTPLQIIRGFAELLFTGHAGTIEAPARQYAQRIVKATERMEDLIQDLLSYSQLSRAELDLQPLRLSFVVAEVMSSLEMELRERQAQMQINEPLPTVVGHRTTLYQALNNLAANALKYVPPERVPQIRIWAEPHGRSIRLWIADNGIGIAPEYQERIFRLFERGPGAEGYPGTGIGLAIVRKGVERMGGQVGVESVPGQGSQFWVELPAG